jgi:hypothetical protein
MFDGGRERADEGERRSDGDGVAAGAQLGEPTYSPNIWSVYACTLRLTARIQQTAIIHCMCRFDNGTMGLHYLLFTWFYFMMIRFYSIRVQLLSVSMNV